MFENPTGSVQQLEFTDYGWPINPKGVGKGANTRTKLEEFRRIAMLNVALVRNINVGQLSRLKAAFPYVVLDPTSGPGGYIYRAGSVDISLIGTPLRAALACHEMDPRGGYRMGFIEKNPVWAECLTSRLAEMGSAKKVDLSNVDVLTGRYEDLAVQWVEANVPEWGARGLVVPDPNGEFGFDTLAALGKLPHLSRVDFALHISGALLKWWQKRGMPQLEDAMQVARKRHWFIGPVTTNFQWAWIFGSNWADYPELRRIGLVSAHSTEGERRLFALCQTHAEIKRHEEEYMRQIQPGLDLDDLI